MTKPTFYRISGLAAMIGGVIGLFNIPRLTLAYFATADGAEFAHAPMVAAWVGVAQPLRKPLLSFGTADAVYLTFGKVMLLVFLGRRVVCTLSGVDRDWPLVVLV